VDEDDGKREYQAFSIVFVWFFFFFFFLGQLFEIVPTKNLSEADVSFGLIFLVSQRLSRPGRVHGLSILDLLVEGSVTTIPFNLEITSHSSVSMPSRKSIVIGHSFPVIESSMLMRASYMGYCN
jgi:hypothetical protein